MACQLIDNIVKVKGLSDVIAHNQLLKRLNGRKTPFSPNHVIAALNLEAGVLNDKELSKIIMAVDVGIVLGVS